VAFERNDLAEAQRCLREANAVGQEALLHVLTPGLLLSVRLLQALGQAELARTRLLELEASVSRSDVRREVHLCLAWLALAQGDLAAAQHWATELAEAGASLALVRREEETLLRARLRIAEGQEDRALAELAPLLQETRDAGRLHRALQILVLQARAQAAGGNDVQARMTVLQAVTLASKAGYQRLFLEEGQFMKTVLQHLLSDLQEPALASFVRRLLLAFGPALDPAAASAEEEPSVLREPLTVQEQRVLSLLAEGASNQEIASTLVIGLSTAKKHVSNLLSKLGAQNRTQAIVRARANGLL
jgi:LuxR family maltose regulon positive regulatory protein